MTQTKHPPISCTPRPCPLREVREVGAERRVEWRRGKRGLFAQVASSAALFSLCPP